MNSPSADHAVNVGESMTIAIPQAASASIAPASGRGAGADVILAAAVRVWFVTAVIGQWAFLYYIAAFYDTATLSGNFATWNRNTFLLKGYVAGDVAGNFAFAAHVLLATIVTFGGALQLIPQLRARFTAVHRWNGGLFLLTALAAAT